MAFARFTGVFGGPMVGALLREGVPRAQGLGLLWALLPAVAWGHGAVPETINVVFASPDDEVPLVMTSFGVVLSAGADDWDWVCEDLTGQTYGTLFEALPDGTWLFGATLGLWRSEDRCDWATIPALDGAFISGLAADPEVDGRVWLSTTTLDAANGLWRSDDSGRSWTLQVGPEILGEGAEVRGFVRDGDTWALVGWRGGSPYLWWSEGLEDWTELPIADLPDDASVTPLGVDPDEPLALWLRYNGAEADQLVHASLDGVFEVRLELADNLLGFATGPDVGQVEVGGRTAGLHRSADGGATWQEASFPAEVGCIVDHAGTRYLCANNWLDEGGVIAGAPGGEDWTPILDFADVHGTLECPSGTETQDVCAPLWEGTRSFAGLDQVDLGLGDDTGADDTDKGGGCGCASGAPGGAGMMGFAAVLLGLVRRSRRGLLALPLLTGCAGGDAVPPSVGFLSPEDGAVVCGDAVAFELDVEGFELIGEVVADPDELPEGQGHAHIFLNGQYVYEAGEESFTLDEPVEAGSYQVKVELANANHAPVEPYVYDLIYLTVDDSVCEGGAS